MAGEFTTKVTVARPNSNSLRTTIPESVVKLMDLNPGNEISWTVKALREGFTITLTRRIDKTKG
jgi:antitoxin component of MazEF toxin-antitoxin module